ncbi:2-isopropylmalate synthase [Candidatus Tremblaya phenacola PAVE]|nr:2-isopropylmalate synthase [Candidatus Tremblaya phenacola PAVE]
MDENIILLDTTLRDGEQSPGVALSPKKKLLFSQKLELAEVEAIEIGFAASSQADRDAVRMVSFCICNSSSCSLARAGLNDIKAASLNLRLSRKPRIHTFIASSKLHIKKKLKFNCKIVKQKAKMAVRIANSWIDDVEFSPEDSSRTSFSFLFSLLSGVADAGATVLNIPDTVGNCLPEPFGGFVRKIRSFVFETDKITTSTHCHDDLGLAVSNALYSIISGGVRQSECTINGIGERAGNAALEELVLIVKMWGAQLKLGVLFYPKMLRQLSQLAIKITKLPLAPNKSAVGTNAFSHASGIHQDGVQKDRRTYEIVRAEDLGWEKNRIVLGKLSGFSGFKSRLLSLFPTLKQDEMLVLFQNFKKMVGWNENSLSDSELILLVKGPR